MKCCLFYTTKEFARKIGVSEATLRRWDKEDKLKPHHRTEGRYRMYSEQQVHEYLNENSGKNTIEKIQFENFTNEELDKLLDKAKEIKSDRKER